MILYPIAVSNLQYLESGQFIVRFVTDFNNTGLDASTDVDFFKLMQQMQGQSTVYNKALTQIAAKVESEELLRRDLIRDQKLTTVRRALYVFEYIDDAPRKEAFATLKIVLNNYSGLEKDNFEAESLGIDNLLKDLRDSKYLPLVQLLGMEEHINHLDTANTNFKTLFNKRSTDTINTEVYDTRTLRKELLATYKDLAEYITVMAKRKNNDYYNGILAVLNNGRQYYAAILAKREGIALANKAKKSSEKK